MQVSSETAAWTVAAGSIAALVVQSARVHWVGNRAARRVRVIAEQGSAGEEDAEQLLVRHGYVVEDRQIVRSWAFLVDGQEQRVDARADFLVSRGGRRFVAEAKTGKSAPRASHPPTRRQLLEYHGAFDVDGILLVHAAVNSIQEIEFSRSRTGAESIPRTNRMAWLIVGFVLGALVGAAAVSARLVR